MTLVFEEIFLDSVSFLFIPSCYEKISTVPKKTVRKTLKKK